MPTRVSCACVLVPAADHDVAGRCRPFDRRPCTPDWPTPHNPVIAPVTVLPRHANDQLLNFSLDLRPAGLRRAFEPSNLRATSLRYQAKMVSGRATLATLPRTLRPNR